MTVATLLVCAGAATVRAAPVDLVVEARNYSKTLERQALYDAPRGQLLLRQVSAANLLAATQAQLNDAGRAFAADLCWNGVDGCAGDARLYDWQKRGYGIVEPVLFTARNGATLSGHVWATRAGPAHRPGVVITNGSVQADEAMYWYAAQTLAKDGYVVMTWDPQGQGQSDTLGAAPDQLEGVPAQTDGRPFFDGTEDAINFFESTPDKRYVPRSSCTSGTSHADKQTSRSGAGLDAGYNPFFSLFDHKRLGLAGHSYGAAGVSYIGQFDARVDAIVAWDNLSQPATSAAGSFPPGERGCPAHPGDRSPAAKLHAPALGMSADYFLPPTPQTELPPDAAECAAAEQAYEQGKAISEADGVGCKSLASDEYSKHGVDTGQIVIRGGSHLDFSFIPNPAFGASLRGADLIDWYTAAWFDKYVKGDKTADARLLSDRWRHDSDEAAVDPTGDGNAFSFYHHSRLAFTTAGGTKVDCEDLRSGCQALSAGDGYPGNYSYFDIDTSPDGAGSASTPAGTGIRGFSVRARRCVSRRRVVVHLGRVKGARITRVVARVGKRRVGHARGRRIVVRLRGLPKGRFTVRLHVTLRRAGTVTHVVVKRRYRTCTKRAVSR